MNKRLVADDEAHVAYSIDFEAQKSTSVAKPSVVKTRLMKERNLTRSFSDFLHNFRVGNLNV